jgi:sulfite reductase alpha subunit-like flavoprotein
VVAPENPEELSGAMAAVLALDRVSVAKMRRTVIRRIQQHFDVAESNRRILEFLES